MKKLLLTLTICAVFSAGALAQITVPKYSFESVEDYSRYNDAILECCNWLINTPLDEAYDSADGVIGFIVKWSMGSPDVMILVDDYFMPYMETNPTLMVWHIAGASKYQLERGIYATTKEDIRESAFAGLNTVLDYYQANKEFFNPVKSLDKLLKTRSKGKLEAYVANRVRYDISEEELDKSNHGRKGRK